MDGKKYWYVIYLQLQGDLPTPLTHNNTQQHTATHNNRQQHTTTVHNSTRVHKTTNVPVVFMALILNGFEECNIITRGIGRGGPLKISTFLGQNGTRLARAISGPTPSNASRNDVALLKTITYCVKKTTGTLIVISSLYTFSIP
jgi:hypothetical protein